MKLLLKIKYDGSLYAGYQVQKNAVTIQQKLNEALSDLFGFECDISGCSRTDAGVHARYFCATVAKHGQIGIGTDIPVDRIPLAINARLPDDIAVCAAVFVDDSFHARYSVISKTYEYIIYDSPYRDPFYRDRSYHYPKTLDDSQIALMQEAADRICGKHDFSAFMSSGSNIKDTIRNVYYCNVIRKDNMVSIRICADGFLYNMVRIICGTLLEVAKGNILPKDIDDIVASRDRRRAGPTLPAEGLYLSHVKYPVGFFD